MRKLNKLFLIGFCFISLALKANYGDKKTTILSDINEDGRIDRVIININEEASGEYYQLDFFIAGSKQSISSYGEYDFSSFFGLVALPDSIDFKNKSFLKSLSKTLFNVEFKKVENSSEIAWCNSVFINKTDLKNNDSVDLFSSFRFHWFAKSVGLLNNYSTIKDSREIAFLIKNTKEFINKSNKYLVAYYGNNHSETNSIKNLKILNYNIYYTNHGIAVDSSSCYSWVFITERSLLDWGVDKLRYASIANVFTIDSYIIVKIYSRIENSNKLIIIDISNRKLFTTSNKNLIEFLSNIEVDKISNISLDKNPKIKEKFLSFFSDRQQ